MEIVKESDQLDLGAAVASASEVVSILGPATRVFLHEAAHIARSVKMPDIPVRIVLAETEGISSVLRSFGGDLQSYLDSDLGLDGISNWHLVSSCSPLDKCVICDNQVVYVMPAVSTSSALPTTAITLRSAEAVALFREHFKILWNNADSRATVHHQDMLTGLAKSHDALVLSSQDLWDEMIARLSKQPERLYELPPRAFEELIAELLSRDGLEVYLTPQARDGGRDILAKSRQLLGDHLYLVECKRYAPTRPVGVALLRALYGVVAADKATMGVLVTTSRFSRDAMSFQQTVKHQMSLRQYEDLVSWLRRHSF